MFTVYKHCFGNHLNKRTVPPANASLVYTLISIGDVTRNRFFSDQGKIALFDLHANSSLTFLRGEGGLIPFQFQNCRCKINATAPFSPNTDSQADCQTGKAASEIDRR